MRNLFVVLGLLLGMLLPLQAGSNNTLRHFLQDPVKAALVSFLSGTIALALYVLLTRPSLPPVSVLSQVPWWAWVTGGLCGACYITCTILIVPKLGVATMFSLIITGQMMVAMVMDHFGILGFPLHPITPWRVMGVMFLILGVVMIRIF